GGVPARRALSRHGAPSKRDFAGARDGRARRRRVVTFLSMEDPRAPIAETIRRLEQLLELMPSEMVKNLRHRIATLRATLLESRPPALLLVGRRGSGKSSLVNALFGKKMAEVGHVKAQTGRGKWYEYAS